MCVRKVGYLVAEKRFVAIPLLPPSPPPDKDATSSKFVVEIQCSNRACRYHGRRRQEVPLMMQSLAQCARSCGNFSCFYPGCRVIPVLDPSPHLFCVILQDCVVTEGFNN